MTDKIPKTIPTPSGWTPAMVAEFERRRRGRNRALLGALGGFCIIIYIIAIVKLHEYGQMW
jgi:hypothetical protein